MSCRVREAPGFLNCLPDNRCKFQPMFRFSFALIAMFLVVPPLQAQSDKRPPNIVVILADDLGWADLSCYGSTFYETPNLDKLAAKGIRFTQAYSTSPVCSPTRASLLTGKSPVHTGVTDWIPGRQANGKVTPYEKLIAQPTAYRLALDETTISEYAAGNGYKTFFAGKWHLGEAEKYWPEFQGFQTNKGGWGAGAPTGRVNDSTGAFFAPYKNPRLSDGPTGEYLTDRLTNECISFINENKQAPFFLMMSLYAVHNPLQAPANLVRKYEAKQKQLGVQTKDRFARDEAWMQYENGWKRRLVQDNPVYAAMIENMDWNIGKLLRELERLGIDDNTLVIFTSDNGGLSTAEGSPTTNAPLRAGKGWLYEGGIRVPMIMYWKEKTGFGSISDVPVTSTDVFPSIATAINGSYQKSKNMEGENIFKLLDLSSKQRHLFWYYPHYSNQGGKPGAAIRSGDYKLIYYYEDGSLELFNLSVGVGEQHDIAQTHKEKVASLKKDLFKWLKSTGALSPNKNPLYKTGTANTDM